MSHLLVNDAHLFLEDSGRGEPVLFLHGLLFSLRMWDAQVNALRGDYRCLRFDFRGQGRSEVTRGGYDMDSLAADTAVIIREHIGQPCHLVGLSMGGFVALRVAARHPGWVRSLSLLDSSAGTDAPAQRRQYRGLYLAARLFGIRRVVPQLLPHMFGPAFLSEAQHAPALRRWREHLAGLDRRAALRAARAVMHRQPVLDLLGSIQAPGLVICGEHDELTPLAASQAMADGLPDAEMKVLTDCGHMSAIEQPEEVTHLLREFLAAH